MMTKRYDTLLKYGFLFISAGILLTILIGPFMTERIYYALPFIHWNGVILLASGILFWLFYKAATKTPRLGFIAKKPYILLAIVAVLTFLISIPWIKSYYFKTDWDVTMVIDTATAMGRGDTTWADWVQRYFSMYPNNLFITVLFSKVFAFIKQWDQAYFSLILVLAAINSLVAYLSALVIHRITRRLSLMWIGYFIFYFLLGLSPWTSIPYSDALGLLFPITLLALYQSLENPRWRIAKLSCMALTCAVGYAIKPQSIIVVIAISLITLAYTKLRYWKEACLFLAISGAVFMGVKQFSQSTSLPLDSNLTFSATHFLKMGLNNVTDGGYYYEDVLASRETATQEERRTENIETIKKRLVDYGIFGLLHHQLRKTIYNYGDGTFSWGLEGTFFTNIREESSPLSRFSRSLYYQNRRLYPFFQVGMQALWLLTLALSLGNLFIHRLSHTHRVLFLALIGLFLFESLFEARARYLYTYASLFIVSAMSGLEAWISRKTR